MPRGISQIATSSVRHVPVLAYQAVMTPAAEWAVTPTDFQTELDWLQAQGYIPQKLSDYIRWMRGEVELPKKSIVLTFWNAHATIWTNAWAKLQAKNFKFALMVPGSVVKNEAQLASGIYLTGAQIQTMVASGLAEVHSMGWHPIGAYKGATYLATQIYKGAQINLKWGGIQEEVETSYSYAPFIGTNGALQPVTTTHQFTCLPRSYRGGYFWFTPPLGAQPLAAQQITCRHLLVDQLSVLGTTPGTLPGVTIKARKVGDAWTTLKTGWVPAWSQGWSLVTLTTPFIFKTGTQYELQFITESAAPAAGELRSLGSLTAEGYQGEDTMITSNTAMTHLPFSTGAHQGADIYLLEDLALETLAEVSERAKADAQKNLDYLAALQPAGQHETAYAYYASGYYNGTLFIPSKLRGLHPLQLWEQALATDRWATHDLRNYSPAAVPFAWPLRQLAAAYPVSGLRAPEQVENTIDALSGNAWDYAVDWDLWSVRLGYTLVYSKNFYPEGAKYARAYTHLSAKSLRFNADGSFASGSQDAGVSTLEKLAEWMPVHFVREHSRVLLYLMNYNSQTGQFDPDIARGVFQNAATAVNNIINILKNVYPTLDGVVIDLEGCYSADRSIASSFVQQLWQTMQQQVPGRTLINAVPAKTADDPGHSWSGWCDYAVWLVNSTYANPLTYDFNFDNPGPLAPVSWMQQVYDYASSIVAKSKLLIGIQTYGHWAYWNGSAWQNLAADSFYEYVRMADEKGAKWYYDATAKESYWQTDAVSGTYWQGYGATPRGFKDKLDTFAGQGYAGFSNWAIGHGDALFYELAEEITAFAPLLKLPQGSSQRVNDREGSGSVGSYETEVLERSRDVSITLQSLTVPYFGDLARVMQQQQLHGKKARLRMGYTGINPPQFPVFDTLEVERVEVNEQQTGWRLHLVDPKRSLKSRIFTAATKETPLILSGNPMDLLLVVYQNYLGVGQNPSLSSDAWLQYDPATGLNLISLNRYLDVDSILAYQSGFFRNYYLEFSITEPQEGKAWLEREIYKALGGYPVVDSAGRISPRFWIAPPLAGTAPVFSFTDQNLLEMPAAERAPIVNQATVRMDYDGSRFQTILSYVSGTSFSTFGLQGGQVIESRGLRAARQGISHAALLATKLFRRYGSVVPVWRALAFHAALPVEVGDLVELTHSKVLDPMTGQRGVTNVLCEVLEKQPDYGRARVSFRLLDVRYLAGKTPFALAGPGVPDWPSANQQQKDTYVFIASDSSGLMSDGVAGNSIYG